MSRAELVSRLRAAPAGHRDSEPTLRMLRILLAFESSLYAAVTPVLPHYAHTLHASKPAIGLLAAAYAAGIIPGSLVGGWAAARAGVRRTTVGGLLAFAVTGAAFGFATDLLALDLLRVLQGLACGFIWGGGLTWAIAIAPRERRGAVIGSVIGAAIFGTLVGPLLGVFAVSAGTAPVFSAVGVAAVVLAFWVRRHPDPGSAEIDVPDQPATIRVHGRALLAQSGLWLGAWLVLMDAMSTGAVSALLPLRLSRLGASGLAIGATFVLASAVATLLAPVIGRASDRHGARRPMSVGLISGAALFAAMTLPGAWVPLAGISVLLLGGPLSAFMIPAVPMMTASAERVGVTVVVATSLVNLAYAIGETIGAPTAALLSTASSDAVPFLAVAGLMLLSLVLVRRSRRTRRPVPPAGPSRPAAGAPLPAAVTPTNGESRVLVPRR
jgi:MFS family permease